MRRSSFEDEDVFMPREFRTVASSTMETLFDRFNIIGYKQTVQGRRILFDPDEIIRNSYLDVDGKVKGFTPLESAIVQLELLRFMWQNMLSLEKNGGHPDKLFILKNERVMLIRKSSISQLSVLPLVGTLIKNALSVSAITILFKDLYLASL